jgi:hypothetical protein
MMASLNTMLIPDAQLWHDDMWHPVVKDQDGLVRWSESGQYATFDLALGAAQTQVQVMAWHVRHQLRLPFVLEEVA